MPSRNPPWSRDELILALDLYFTMDFPNVAGSPPVADVKALSDTLNKLSIHTERPDAQRFRNLSGVAMKLSNFLSLDPSTSWQGLSHGGKMDEVIWKEFVNDRERIHSIAAAIRAQVDSPQELDSTPPLTDDDDGALEGRVLLRVHHARERKPALVAQKKQNALAEHGVLQCEVCDFVFSDRYGPLGDGYIECHHTVPLSELKPGQRTRQQDLALVCSNCHRMLHRQGKTRTISELRELVHTWSGERGKKMAVRY